MVPAVDAERLLRDARRPLVLGIGGGGDVVGALATAEHLRCYAGAEPVRRRGQLGAAADRPASPEPGRRRRSPTRGQLAPGVLLAGPSTRVARRGVRFAESRMAELLGQPHGADRHPPAVPPAVAAGLQQAVAELERDLIVFLDVGGDVLADGDEPGLRSPLCDAMMLAVAERLRQTEVPVLLAVFGTGLRRRADHRGGAGAAGRGRRAPVACWRRAG